MERAINTKNKSLYKQNGETFQRLRSKIKKTFSKNGIRSMSIPRSTENRNNISSKKHQSSFKSNNSSRSSTPDINWFSKMSQSTVSNDYHEQIELHSLNFRNNNNNNNNNATHYFISQKSKDKLTYCDVCNEELMPMGSVLTCKYCQVVLHEKCCDNIEIICHNNRLSVINNYLDLDKISLNQDVNEKNSSDYSQVKLRKRSVQTSSSDSEYHSCKTSFIDDNSRASFNFYHGGLETIQCRDSLVSVTSITSISTLMSHVSYDFTTLDRDSIQAYGIEVNPINQRATASLDQFDVDEESMTDVSSYDSSSDSYEYFCKPSFIYRDQSQDMVKIEWTKNDLIEKTEIFNKNNFGLTTEIKSYKGEKKILGTVRVYINLLRPIKMQFSSRPSSIFDVINFKEKEDLFSSDTKTETLWLPRGTSKQLYVNQSTTTSEVINGLLTKFHIKANPKKFGLYEHTIEGERRVSVRKLVDVECPLAMLLMWTEEGIEKLNEIMAFKRLVLQENETGDIEWTGFSKPELHNFLLILDREEEENKNKIRLKYKVLKNEILRLENLLKMSESVTKTL